MQPINQIIKELESEKNQIATTEITGLTSGFSALDYHTGGFQKGQLTVLASRPSMGITTLALNFARNSALQVNASVLIFSLDNLAKRLTQNLLKAEQATKELKPGDQDKKLVNANINIDDSNGINILDIMEKSANLKREKGLDFIIIDSLQFIYDFEYNQQKSRKKNLELIVRLLKVLAISLDLPILLLSKLPKQVDIRGGYKRPMLFDLSKYGNLENYADVVLFLYRLGYYGITQDQYHENVEDLSEVLIVKNRNGANSRIFLRHDFEKAIFLTDNKYGRGF
jgi:replicative DNA helicase